MPITQTAELQLIQNRVTYERFPVAAYACQPGGKVPQQSWEKVRKTASFLAFGVVSRCRIGYTKGTAGARFGLPYALQTGGFVTFLVGDKVIYPNHGLGIVERIEEKTILGTTCGFYHLRIVANDTTVLVPVSNVDGVGLRRAITDDEAWPRAHARTSWAKSVTTSPSILRSTVTVEPHRREWAVAEASGSGSRPSRGIPLASSRIRLL